MDRDLSGPRGDPPLLLEGNGHPFGDTHAIHVTMMIFRGVYEWGDLNGTSCFLNTEP